MDQAGLEFTKVRLLLPPEYRDLSAGIKRGVLHHAQLALNF